MTKKTAKKTAAAPLKVPKHYRAEHTSDRMSFAVETHDSLWSWNPPAGACRTLDVIGEGHGAALTLRLVGYADEYVVGLDIFDIGKLIEYLTEARDVLKAREAAGLS